jgi:hypothetical protein
MEQTIRIGLFALIPCIAAVIWIIGKRKNLLDRAYHDALHAESTGQYDTATKLYQSILDRSWFFMIMDEGIRSHIKRRMNTLRHEQDYLAQFLTNKMP